MRLAVRRAGTTKPLEHIDTLELAMAARERVYRLVALAHPFGLPHVAPRTTGEPVDELVITYDDGESETIAFERRTASPELVELVDCVDELRRAWPWA